MLSIDKILDRLGARQSCTKIYHRFKIRPKLTPLYIILLQMSNEIYSMNTPIQLHVSPPILMTLRRANLMSQTLVLLLLDFLEFFQLFLEVLQRLPAERAAMTAAITHRICLLIRCSHGNTIHVY